MNDLSVIPISSTMTEYSPYRARGQIRFLTEEIFSWFIFTKGRNRFMSVFTRRMSSLSRSQSLIELNFVLQESKFFPWRYKFLRKVRLNFFSIYAIRIGLRRLRNFGFCCTVHCRILLQMTISMSWNMLRNTKSILWKVLPICWKYNICLAVECQVSHCQHSSIKIESLHAFKNSHVFFLWSRDGARFWLDTRSESLLHLALVTKRSKWGFFQDLVTCPATVLTRVLLTSLDVGTSEWQHLESNSMDYDWNLRCGFLLCTKWAVQFSFSLFCHALYGPYQQSQQLSRWFLSVWIHGSAPFCSSRHDTAAEMLLNIKGGKRNPHQKRNLTHTVSGRRKGCFKNSWYWTKKI